jgi:sugar phosphate isomerase/epimerase
MADFSLSGRLIEIRYKYCEMSVPDFMRFARKCGYRAVELRSTQITADTTEEEAEELRGTADDMELAISGVFMPGDLPADDSGLRRLEMFAGIVQKLGCDTLKTWANEVYRIQRICDMLRERGMKLITQTHTGGPFETLSLCLDTIKQIDRANFGLQYDPANFFEAEEDYGEGTVKKLGEHIHQLSVQNCRLASTKEQSDWEHEGRYYKRCVLWDSEGLEYNSVVKGLKAIRFNGYVTLNEAKPTLMETEPFAGRALEELQKLFNSEQS